MTEPTVQELIKQLFALITLENVRPQRDRIIVRELKEEASSVLWTPETKRSTKGIVIASGPGHYNKQGALIPTDISPGDCVLFNQHVGEVLNVKEEKVRMIKASDILAKIS